MGDIEKILNQKKAELEALKRKISSLESDIEALERASVIMSSENVKNGYKPSPSTIFDLLDAFREENKLGVYEMCDLLGISSQSILNWKNGTVPKMATMANISNKVAELSQGRYSAETVMSLFRRMVKDGENERAV